MAPQLTIYFHKFPATTRGASGCRMTFTLGRPKPMVQMRMALNRWYSPRLLPIQIMIGSIPITLGTTESVMVTSIEEREASHPKTSKVKFSKKSIKISKKASRKQKVTPQPKAMWPRILELNSPKSDHVVKGKEVAMDIDASFETLPPSKQGPRKSVRREESQISELFDHFLLTTLCAEQSKRPSQTWRFKNGHSS